MANSKNPIIKDVFAKLASLNSKHRHDIYIGTELGSKTNAPESSSYTRTRLTLDYDNKLGFTDYEIIGHELKHAYDIEFNLNTNKKDANGTELDEYWTSNFENLIRKEEGRPQRTKYGRFKIPKEEMGNYNLYIPKKKKK